MESIYPMTGPLYRNYFSLSIYIYITRAYNKYYIIYMLYIHTEKIFNVAGTIHVQLFHSTVHSNYVTTSQSKHTSAGSERF